jgi:hypothetical protein
VRLAQGRPLVANVLNDIAAHDCIEASIVKRQVLRTSTNELDVLIARFVQPLPCKKQPTHRDIDPHVVT